MSCLKTPRWRVLLLMLLVTGLVSCERSSPGDGSAPGDPSSLQSNDSKGTIGVSLMTLTNPFFKVIGDNITSEAEKFGYDTVYLGADEDASKQTDQVKDFIVKNVAAIVLAPYDSQAIGPVIEEANAAGIPVFTVDNACLATGAKVTCHVATDNLMGGRQAAQAMVDAVGETGGKIAILDHKVTQSCIDRVTGFKDVLNAHNASAENPIEIVPNCRRAAIVKPDIVRRRTSYRATQISSACSASTTQVRWELTPALVEANKAEQVTIIGFDGQPEGKKAIRDGKIYADPIQFPARMGRKTVEVIMSHFDGDDVPPEF